MPEQTSLNYRICDSGCIRPEELIIQIYKNKMDLQEKGIPVKRIIMPMKFYKIIKSYHLSLGEIQSNFTDYITEDEIFGIPVYIGQIDYIKVE